MLLAELIRFGGGGSKHDTITWTEGMPVGGCRNSDLGERMRSPRARVSGGVVQQRTHADMTIALAGKVPIGDERARSVAGSSCGAVVEICGALGGARLRAASRATS